MALAEAMFSEAMFSEARAVSPGLPTAMPAIRRGHDPQEATQVAA